MKDALEPNRCARMLRALADPERLRIISCLRDGPRNVSQLAALLGVEIVNVSHHLGVLRHAGVVLDEKQGRFVLYRLHPDVFHPPAGALNAEHLDLGCCRLEMPRFRKREESK
ncbi:MAG TPA: metalloregulator ArsR/SmtB family transcription factor [Gemmataceae bacterium]|nr:metalloregulator ArsR/SmtB family transcription factor [Gemmataceae bacterium]